MADQPVPSLARAREIKIDELSTHFANDDLTLDDLERRIERVYKAASVAELEVITADLKRSATVPPEFIRAKVVKRGDTGAVSYEVPRGRLVSFMSTMRRVGRWAVPRELTLKAIMSDTKIDLTQAVFAADTVDIQLSSVMASVKLVVAPGMRVIMDTNSIMSSVDSRADDLSLLDAPASANAQVIRITGYAFMSDVKVVVRRREQSDDDIDDE